MRFKLLPIILNSIEILLSSLWEVLLLTKNQNKSILRSWRMTSSGMLSVELFLPTESYLVRSQNTLLKIEFLLNSAMNQFKQYFSFRFSSDYVKEIIGKNKKELKNSHYEIVAGVNFCNENVLSIFSCNIILN